MNDIDCSGFNFKSIGRYMDNGGNNYFFGVLEGNGKIINGLMKLMEVIYFLFLTMIILITLKY